jgi:hypothetical protein
MLKLSVDQFEVGKTRRFCISDVRKQIFDGGEKLVLDLLANDPKEFAFAASYVVSNTNERILRAVLGDCDLWPGVFVDITGAMTMFDNKPVRTTRVSVPTQP